MLWALLPTLDVVTDFFYILTTPFENLLYFALICFFFNAIIFGFAAKLASMKCSCFIFKWVEVDRSSNGLEFVLRSFFCFLLMCAFVFPMVWFVFGALLFQTKLLAIGMIHNFWFYVWTLSTTFAQKKNIEVDSEMLNESFFLHLITETIPQLILQTCNNYSSGETLNSAAVASIFFSSYTALSGLFTFGYYHVITHIL